jgi:hypothetical protein
MRYKSGRGYICTVNYLLLFSVHTTCHRKYQAKLVITPCVFMVTSTQFERQKALPFPYD